MLIVICILVLYACHVHNSIFAKKSKGLNHMSFPKYGSSKPVFSFFLTSGVMMILAPSNFGTCGLVSHSPPAFTNPAQTSLQIHSLTTKTPFDVHAAVPSYHPPYSRCAHTSHFTPIGRTIPRQPMAGHLVGHDTQSVSLSPLLPELALSLSLSPEGESHFFAKKRAGW